MMDNDNRNGNDNDNDNAMVDHYDPLIHSRSNKRRCSSTTAGRMTMTDVNDPSSRRARFSSSSPPNHCHNNSGHNHHSSRDCYDEVTAAIAAGSPFGVRHDWFYEIPRIQQQKLQDTTTTIATTTAMTTDHHHPQQQQEQLLVLQSELRTLDRQLQQVKRRFQVASERCARAVCGRGTADGTTTTASYEFEQARRACNPFEVLGDARHPGGLNRGLFLNRSAIKLANIDAVLNFALARNDSNDGNTFYFADLCAAPGGFSEYLLRRVCHSLASATTTSTTQGPPQRPLSCRGFGMSLVGDNDQGHGTPWRLSQGPLFIGDNNHHNNHHYSDASRSSISYHICHGEDGTGDIFQWRNVESLQRDILMIVAADQQQQHQSTTTNNTTTDGQQQQRAGPVVSLVLADGGVDAQRNVEHPDATTQKLVVCQVAAALRLLQPGGRLVLKLLACQTTPVLQSVLSELHHFFGELQILKPISSRPASAERYLICTGFRPSRQATTTAATTNTTSNPVFDGPKWINRVLLGRMLPPMDPNLAIFLARADRDMLQLNLRACFAILSHLESKTMRLTTTTTTTAVVVPLGMQPATTKSGNSMDEDDDDDDDDEKWIAQGYQNYHYGHRHHDHDHHHPHRRRHHRGAKHHHRKNSVNVEDYRIAWKLF